MFCSLHRSKYCVLRGLSLMTELKPMHGPPHPGEFISEVYLEPF